MSARSEPLGAPGVVTWHCQGCGHQVRATERNVGRGYCCRTCGGSSWSRFAGPSPVSAVEGRQQRRAREGRA